MNELLETILKYNRANPETFIKEVLFPYLDSYNIEYEVDEEYNVFFSTNDAAENLYIAHTDTCDRLDSPKFKELEVSPKGFVKLKDENGPHSCLGADDGAGVYMLMKLIESGIEGKYLFTTGEESGLIGMKHWLNQECNLAELKSIQNCYEFDRRGESEIIIEQSGTRMADLEEALVLSERISDFGLNMRLSTGGIYTDNYLLAGLVPNVYNLSVGYFGEHTRQEVLYFGHVEQLLYAMISIGQDAIYPEIYDTWFGTEYDSEENLEEYYSNIDEYSASFYDEQGNSTLK